MTWKHAASTVVAFSLFAGIASTANAQLIASDSYKIGSSLASGEYTLDANGAGLGTQLFNTAALGASGSATGLVTPGFTNGRYGSGNGTAQFAATSVGLAYAPLGVTSTGSGKVTYTPVALDATVRNTARTLSPTPVTNSTTYWVTALVNRGAVSGSTGLGYMMAGFGGTLGATTLDVGATGAPGLFFGYSGDTGNLAIRYRDTNNLTTESVLVAGSSSLNNVTNALLFKIEVGYAGGVADRLTYWVNPTNFTNEAGLTSTASASSVLTGTNILSSNADFQRLTYITNRWDSSAFYDEMRLGTTLASVTAGAGIATVPEPGTFALLGLGGLAALGVIRRRRAA